MTSGPLHHPSTATSNWWLYAVGTTYDPQAYGPDTGNWCILRHQAFIDQAWTQVCAAVGQDSRLLAKCSTTIGAPAHGGVHVICVYCPASADRDAAMAVPAVLRNLGFTEELGYKRDRETLAGVYGTPDEWLLRA